ncbi:MFS transporter [Acetanaerobacterium elongatum]|uniref:Drug resistance transporter, EmrB/QacA subfamily n=1 Tax=Acetanaerobacterium elongatum TaxID=258515 RepID=A0A1H0GFJ3_9FIRM|nr:MFS transporter [Acetanaerobacterium elongatum]SDO05670.1 drug resistance transporter, EmrB/QacA subfamily [Acetanaerobacterium elongatum]
MDSTNNRKVGLMLFSLALGTFMSALDSSAVSIVLPIIQNHYGVALSSVEWVSTAYLLVVSSLLLTFGRISDLLGHKRVYTTGFLIFTLGSLLCGLSLNIQMLIVCRVIQALGASMMFSSNTAIITANVPAGRRGKAMSVTAIAVAVASCSGPVFGGLLARMFSWQSVFFINIPIGIVGLVLAFKNIPEDERKKQIPFDHLGSLLIIMALFLLLLPLDLIGGVGISLPLFFLLLAVGLAAVGAFVWREKRADYPLMPLGLFKNRLYSFSLIAAVFNFSAQFMLAFLAPFYYQNIKHYSVVMTGLMYLPMPIATLLVAPLSGAISDKHDSRFLSAGGMGLMSAGLLMMSFITQETPNWYIVIAMVLSGIGSGMFQTPNNNAIMGSAPAEFRGIASGTLATMRNVGMLMGVALCGALFNYTSNQGTELFTAQGLVGDALKVAAFTYGLRITITVATGIALLAAVSSLIKGRTKEKTR